MAFMEKYPKSTRLRNPWEPPRVESEFPTCDLCSFSYSDREKIWTLKFRNSNCWRHALRMPQEAPESPLSLFDRLQAGELPGTPPG